MFGVGLVAALGAAIAVSVLRGWVLSYLWLWFLVPLGVGLIGVAQAMGLSLLLSLFTPFGAPKETEKKEGFEALKIVAAKLLGHAAIALIYLGLGYVLSAVMS